MIAPRIAIVRAPPMTTVQDAGRGASLSLGLPPSGPLDPTAHAAANLAVGNEARAAAIEIPLGALEARVQGAPILVSVDGDPPLEFSPGDDIHVPAVERAVRYLAVRGGIDVPVVLGARATLLSARVGGHEGRMLKTGDTLAVAATPGAPSARAPAPLPTPRVPGDPAELEVIPGPHLGRRLPASALDELLGATWRVSRLGDRVGVRLEGASIGNDAHARARADENAAPVPMVRGAIQVVTDGTPIVLGPDHPVTGGYPVVAVLTQASQALLARLRPGRAVQFRLR